MRIALVSNTLPPEGSGGAEQHVATLARELSSRHEVTVLSGARTAAIEGTAQVRLPHLELYDHGAEISGLRKGCWHLADLWQPKVHRAVVRALAEIRPDVVHTHSVQGLSSAVFTGINRVGVGHVNTAHDLGILCMRTAMTRDAERCSGRCLSCRPQRLTRATACSRGIDALIAPSDHVRRIHVEHGVIAEEQSHWIANGVDPAPGRLREMGELLRVGYIGTLGEHKGVGTLLECFQGGPENWRLNIAGSGPMQGQVQRASEGDPRISYAGRISGETKERFYDELDLLIVASQWEENGPIVIREAAIRGLPAIVSNRGGLPESPEARVIPDRDPIAMRDAIEWFESDPERLRGASSRLLARAGEFTLERQIRLTEIVLAEAAGGKL